jgi:hypothetical protein
MAAAGGCHNRSGLLLAGIAVISFGEEVVMVGFARTVVH